MVLTVAFLIGPLVGTVWATTYNIYSKSEGRVIHSIMVADGSDTTVTIIVP